jgi:hypothetical protein
VIQCALCLQWFDPTAIEIHLIEDHGQEPVERWPDGSPVIIDTTLTPDDFGEAQP